jgi:hypothetical protein
MIKALGQISFVLMLSSHFKSPQGLAPGIQGMFLSTVQVILRTERLPKLTGISVETTVQALRGAW